MTNVVIFLADDLGYSDIGCYGGEIRTPNIDSLGDSGIRMSNFHNTPVFSMFMRVNQNVP